MKIEPATMKEHGEEVIKMAKDPVCCMDVDEKTAPASSEPMGWSGNLFGREGSEEKAMEMEPSTMKEHGKRVMTMAKDPVCCMDVDEKTAPARSEHMGKTYYFCSPGCKIAFDEKLRQVYRRRYTLGGWHEM